MTMTAGRDFYYREGSSDTQWEHPSGGGGDGGGGDWGVEMRSNPLGGLEYWYHDGEDANGPFPQSDMKEWCVDGCMMNVI